MIPVGYLGPDDIMQIWRKLHKLASVCVNEISWTFNWTSRFLSNTMVAAIWTILEQ